MARPLRVHIAGALYHVMSRGNARQQIFLADEDFSYFLERLSGVLYRFGVRCFAYCLMDNHYHLLAEPDLLPLSRMMQQLNSIYSQWFNRQHDRVGHVLQGRFKALVIDRDAYFRRVLRYIALNPVRAGVVQDPAGWRWSSYRATAGLDPAPPFLSVTDIWKTFDSSDQLNAQRLYAAFVAEGADETSDAPEGPLAWGSEAFAVAVRARVKPQRGEGDIVRAERFVGRPPLDRLLTVGADPSSVDAMMREAFERHGYKLREIGDAVGQRPCTVWRRIQRAASRAHAGGAAEKIEI